MIDIVCFVLGLMFLIYLGIPLTFINLGSYTLSWIGTSLIVNAIRNKS
jgi:hypothetical protein